jgi:eukaryotic-like serine/threonine-protein kinase
MELVDGPTLRTWLTRSRGYAEILDVFSAAGRGIRAAHAAGLVHRDFKPDNVMIGSEGRVRVMDFGLARAAEDPEERPEGDTASSRLSTQVTQHGGFVGTPAYMAPELFMGEPATPASDQFAFCVALWEALYDERPFAGTSPAELALSVTEGKLRRPPHTRVPAWVRRAVERGLSMRPQARWPTMEDLLVALHPSRGRTRRRAGWLAVAAGVVGIGLVARDLDRRQRIAGCEDQADALSSAWNEDARDQMLARFRGSGLGYAEDAYVKTALWLDGYATRWRDARVDSCIAFEMGEHETPSLRTRVDACFDERRAVFVAVVDALVHADAGGVERSIGAAAGLPDIAACTDANELLEHDPAPAGEAEAIAAVGAMLARAEGLTLAGDLEAAWASAVEAEQRALELDWAPLIARARYRVGDLAERRGEYETAEAKLREAYFGAGAAGADETAARAASTLVFLIGDRMARHEEGRWWIAHAEMASERLGGSELVQAELLSNVGAVFDAMGEYEQALERFEQAREILERNFGPEHPRVAVVLNFIGGVHDAAGDPERALGYYSRVLEIRERSLGSNHPRVGFALDNIGSALAQRGEPEQARTQLERALAVLENGLGPEHPDVGISLTNLGSLEFERGNYQRALEVHARALAIFETAFGQEHPYVAAAMGNVALAQEQLGDVEAAAEGQRRALQIKERTLGPDHPDLAETHVNLGVLYGERGEWALAQRHLERAVALIEPVGAEHPVLGHALSDLGQMWLDQHLPERAIEPLERAVRIFDEKDRAASVEGSARFGLARALWETGGDRDRATTLARQAREDYVRAGDSDVAAQLARIEDWLARHG